MDALHTRYKVAEIGGWSPIFGEESLKFTFGFALNFALRIDPDICNALGGVIIFSKNVAKIADVIDRQCEKAAERQRVMFGVLSMI